MTTDFEEVLYQLYVRKKVNEGLNDIEKGNIVPDDKMEKFWLQWSEKKPQSGADFSPLK